MYISVYTPFLISPVAHAINYIKETRFDIVQKYLDGHCIKELDRPEILDIIEAMGPVMPKGLIMNSITAYDRTVNDHMHSPSLIIVKNTNAISNLDTSDFQITISN